MQGEHGPSLFHPQQSLATGYERRYNELSLLLFTVERVEWEKVYAKFHGHGRANEY